MVSIYLLIISGDVIDETSSFFKIKVGSGAADTAQFHALRVLAAQRNWYFAPYNHESADFLDKIAVSLAKTPDRLGIKTMTVKDFLKAWKDYSNKLSDGIRMMKQLRVSHQKALNKRQKPPKEVIQHAESVRRIKPKSLLIDFKAYIHQIY